MSESYEKKDIQVRPLLFAGIAIIILVVVCSLLMATYYRSFDESWQPSNPYAFEGKSSSKEKAAPEMMLQTNPVEDLKEMRDAEKQQLTSYGWIDRESKTVHIPVDRAIEIIAERGLAVESKEEVAS